MDSEALQRLVLIFREDRKILHTSVKTSVDWLANKSPPWAAYCSFMSGHLITLDKQPDVCPVGVGKTWRRIFSKTVLKVTGPEATMSCQDDQLCARHKSVIGGAVHGVQAIWDEK